MAFHERRTRSIIKAVSYRVVSITVDSLFVYLLTRKVDLTLGIVLITNTYSTFLYYLHERAWNNFHWGKAHHSHTQKTP